MASESRARPRLTAALRHFEWSKPPGMRNWNPKCKTAAIESLGNTPAGSISWLKFKDQRLQSTPHEISGPPCVRACLRCSSCCLSPTCPVKTQVFCIPFKRQTQRLTFVGDTWPIRGPPADWRTSATGIESLGELGGKEQPLRNKGSATPDEIARVVFVPIVVNWKLRAVLRTQSRAHGTSFMPALRMRPAVRLTAWRFGRQGSRTLFRILRIAPRTNSLVRTTLGIPTSRLKPHISLRHQHFAHPRHAFGVQITSWRETRCAATWTRL